MQTKPYPQRLSWLITLGAGLIAFVLLSNWLSQQTMLAQQGQKPEPRPAFGGRPITATLTSSANLPKETIAWETRGPGWQQVYTETFEAGINPTIWTSFDQDGTTNGEYKWGTEIYTNTTPSGTRSAWAVGDGEQGGTLDPATDGYPPNAKSWLVYGPVDMSNAIEGMVMFDYWYEASAGDPFAVMASTDGTNYAGIASTNGGSGGWSQVMYDLTSYAGQAQLYIAFVFTSDGTTNPSNFKSVFLDEVIFAFNFLETVYLPSLRLDPTLTPTATPTKTPTPTATPTATPTQNANPYVDDFNNPSSNWAMRRQSTGPGTVTNSVSYVAGGRLELNVSKPGHYVLAAPMAVAPSTSRYKIETQAQLINPVDQSGYGIVFGGNWNGQSCPNSGYTNCFTSYYLLEVRWLANNNNPLLVTRLREITGHDSNNNPTGTILFNWTETRLINGVTINPNGVNEWDIQYESNGTIKIFVQNQLFKTITSETTYFNQKYFGLYASSINDAGGTTNNGVVRYEYISVVNVP